MLADNNKQHYLFVKSLSGLLKKEYACSDNYCINCLKSFKTKLKLKKY